MSIGTTQVTRPGSWLSMAVCRVQGIIVPSVITMSGSFRTDACSPSSMVGFSRAAKGESPGTCGAAAMPGWSALDETGCMEAGTVEPVNAMIGAESGEG